MKKIISILILLLMIPSVNAYDFDPARNITLRDLYSVGDGVSADFTNYYGDGSALTGITHDNTSWNETYADTLYRAEGWDNFTGIPTATPSNGDTTHLSTAHQIYNWIIGLGYTTLTAVENALGNWSNDKSDYWNTSTDLDTVISDDEITEGKIAFSTECTADAYYRLNGNDLECTTPSSIMGEDNGTFILFKFGGTTYMKVEKSTGDLYIAGDIKTREF